MIINTDITIAYKCTLCGAFEFFNISLFGMPTRQSRTLTCRCNKSSITITRESIGHYRISAPCIACSDEHEFTITAKSMISRSIYIQNCPNTNIQHCFIGIDNEVRSKIDKVENELDELINMFGYDSYFKNTRVMFDTLNKIHDIAEKGNLLCECGNDDIELAMLADSVYLKCKKCHADRIIQASSNEDLKHTLCTDHIVLLQEIQSYPFGNINTLLRKTDG
jgi:hypothetical protein